MDRTTGVPAGTAHRNTLLLESSNITGDFMSKRLATAVATVALACGGGLAAAGAAHADTTHGATPAASTHTTIAAMTRIGIDPAVAKAHGYTVVTLSDGSKVSVKTAHLRTLGAHPSDAALKDAQAADSPLPSKASVLASLQKAAAKKGVKAAVTPNDYVYGNCGDSYYFLSVYSDGTWSSLTGYDVVSGVVDFNWWTALNDPSGSEIESIEYGGYATGPSWEGSDSNPPELSLAGWYSGLVTSGTAYLDNGWVCASGHPGDQSYLS